MDTNTFLGASLRLNCPNFCKAKINQSAFRKNELLYKFCDYQIGPYTSRKFIYPTRRNPYPHADEFHFQLLLLASDEPISV